MIDVEKVFIDLNRASDEIYSSHCTGSPLHIVLDDGNVDDSSLAFNYRELYHPSFSTDHSDYIISIAKFILHNLFILSEPQRHIWWYSGRFHNNDEAIKASKIAASVERAKVVNCSDKNNGCYVNLVIDEKTVWTSRNSYS